MANARRDPSCRRMAGLLPFVLGIPDVPGREGPTYTFDVVVYGGTAGGVITAVAAAREGLTVALLEPGRHLGGMVSGGLGWTDYGRKEVIGGYSLEFFERVGRKYGRDIEWHFEPHVAEAVFDELVKEAGVSVFLDRPPAREERRAQVGHARHRNRDGERRGVSAQTVFADATYEGDLMAQAGVSYTWGTRGDAEYNESLAGVREHTPLHQFRAAVSPVRRIRNAAARNHAADERSGRAPPTSASRRTTSACA